MDNKTNPSNALHSAIMADKTHAVVMHWYPRIALFNRGHMLIVMLMVRRH